MEVSRQVRRAIERRDAKARRNSKHWAEAIHQAPQPDPPARLRACAKVIGQKRGHRSDWR